ncbi:hypothetical protein AOLI_G00074970 [Acnodon oligacanthus]
MVVEEVSQVEQDCYLIKAVSQGKQGAWTRWEDTINREVTWADIWRTPQSWLSFLVRTTYDILPCPQNLSQWFGSEDFAAPCAAKSRPGDGAQKTVVGKHTYLLTPGRTWEMRADLGTQLVFPTKITQTTLRPDVVMWSTAAKKVLIIKLTVP